MSSEDTDEQLRELLDSFPDRGSKYDFMRSTAPDVRKRLALILAGVAPQGVKSPSPESLSDWKPHPQFSFPSQSSATLEAPPSQGSLSPYTMDDFQGHGIITQYSRLHSPVEASPSLPSSSMSSLLYGSDGNDRSAFGSFVEDETDLSQPLETQTDDLTTPPKPSTLTQPQVEPRVEPPVKSLNKAYLRKKTQVALQEVQVQQDSSTEEVTHGSTPETNPTEDEDENTPTAGNSRKKAVCKDPPLKGSLQWRMGYKLGSQHAEYIARRREARKICNKMDYTVAWTYNDKITRDLEVDKLLAEYQEHGYNRAICEDLIMDICQKGANVAKRPSRNQWKAQNPGQKQKPGRKPKLEQSTVVTGEYKLSVELY